MEYNIVLCTVNSKDLAICIAKSLVTEKLAACVNICDNITSVYSWEDKVVEDNEVLLVIKSTKKLFKNIETRIKELHPYEVPEIISLDIENGSDEYLKWLTKNVM